MDVQTDGHAAQIVRPWQTNMRRVEPTDMRSTSPLSSLAATPMASRFCAWRGASDRRYVATVYGADLQAADGGLPDFEAFILLAVARGRLGRRILNVAAIERASDRHAALAAGRALGVDEWHVHFLGEDRQARAALVADLRGRHCDDAAEARCA